MSFSSRFFKRTLGFSFLVFLASLVFSNQGFAMLRPADGLPEGEPAPKKPRLDDPTNLQTPEHKPLIMDSLNTLILQAKEGALQAQDELMETYYQGLYCDLLTPERLDFLTWKSQDVENLIENNCYNNDFYAYFVISHFKKIGEHFPKLFERTKERADQGTATAQFNLGVMYLSDRGVKKNGIEALHWYIKSKHQTAKTFIRTVLPKTQSVPLTGDSFQEMLIEIMRGKNLNLDEEGGLARLIGSHQAKIGVNNKMGYREGKTAIPALAHMFKPIEEVEVDAMNMMACLATTKPGFMVTAVSLSQSMKNQLSNQITPFFSLDELNGVFYLTMGEENGRLANRFVTFLKESDTKFAEADKALEHCISKVWIQS